MVLNRSHTDDLQKRHRKNCRNFSVRLNVFFFLIFFMFVILIVRLATVQLIEGPVLKEKESQLGFRQTAIPPLRGTIYDASNTRLAYSTVSQSLYFSIEGDYGDINKKLTKRQRKKREEAQQLAQNLAVIFNKLGGVQDKNKLLTAEEIVKRMDLEGKMSFSFVPRLIKTGLTKEEIAYFLVQKKKYKDISIVEDSVRNYSHDMVAVQTVGYLKKFRGVREQIDFYKHVYKNQQDILTEKKHLEYEDVGVDGIEFMYQDELRGLNGVKTFPVNVAGRIIGSMQLTKPQRGHNIHLTIHRDIQQATEKAIEQTLQKIRHSSNPKERASNAQSGYAVAMEIDTGNVVASASMPDYNPNVWRNGQISGENYKKIQHCMYNGAIREVYGAYRNDKERNQHPTSLVYLGSVMKPLTILAGLKEQLFNAQAIYLDKGYAEFGRRGYETKVWNSNRAVYGAMDAIKALNVSSNPFMIDMIGQRLFRLPNQRGLKIWDKYMEAFGLGVKTGSGLPGESEGIKDYLVEAKRNNAQSALVYASFGQQGKYTPLQLAQYATTLANHGKRIKPQFVSKITDGNGKVIQSFAREVLSETKFDDKHWQTIEAGMLQVNVHGFAGFPYSFYRKTGTSEQSVGGKKIENAVFIAYAPADKPKLAVAVVVPEGGYGSYGAAPIARQMFDAYDQVYGLTGVPKFKKK